MRLASSKAARHNRNLTIPSTSPRLSRRLGSYALAAGAAGVAMAAVPAKQNSSNIVYTPANIQFGSYDGGARAIPIDLDHDGITDFGFLINNSIPGYSAQGNLSIFNAPVGNAAITGQALNRGAIIGKNSGTFKQGRNLLAFEHLSFARSSNSSAHSRTYGAFANVTDKYLGVRFLINGEDHYGWVRFTVSSAQGSVTGTITGYAYNTVAGQSLKAGEPGTHSNAVDARPASLGALSLGAAGVEMWRGK
jgi:hypothetical protein